MTWKLSKDVNILITIVNIFILTQELRFRKLCNKIAINSLKDVAFSPFLRPIRSEAWKGFSPPRSTKSLSSAPCCKRKTAKSNLSASRHTDSGDLLLFLRPLGSALCCKRFFTNSSRFLTSDANTKSSGTQEASHSAAQPSKKSKDRL